MVSSDNIILAGIGVLALVLFGSRIFSSNGNNLISQDEIITPTILPPEIPEIVENPQIQILKDAISGVNSFIKNTFKPPPVKTKVRGQFFLDGVPQSRASIFQTSPKGSRFGTDPFTGLRIALPVGPRGNATTERFFGGVQSLLANQNLVTQGGDLFKQASQIVTDLQGQLNILQTKSV